MPLICVVIPLTMALGPSPPMPYPPLSGCQPTLTPILLQTEAASWLSALPLDLQAGLRLLAFLALLMTALELSDTLLGGRLDSLGIRPRQWRGLVGIGFAPLLHGGLRHLTTNLGPLVVLGSLILLQGLDVWAVVTGLGWLGSGLGVWLLGRDRTNHVGASGLVFCYFGYLLGYGYVQRSPAAVAGAVLVAVLYGGALWQLLPIHRGQSWVGHATGFALGLLAARHVDVLVQWWLHNSGL